MVRASGRRRRPRPRALSTDTMHGAHRARGTSESLSTERHVRMVLATLSSFDQLLTARVNLLQLPLALETLLMPFGCIHGYAGGILGLPILWVTVTNSLGCWEEPAAGLPSGRAGFFFYMYICAVGQTVSGALKIILNRARPGMDLHGPDDARQVLPHRHWLPGSPAFITCYPEEQLRCSPLVWIGGMQHGVTKGLNGSESGSFPSGDSMAGCCFAALLSW
jgi:membrane-associated phospholipid phosphatase